ncbi:metallophosphoesterase family protein [Parapedobacter sp. 10938]|uniref:metallophosphoesterase family protein n=1 Tax=Parapedobacter flavus TaxID=3110225 RepID=UPI002DBD639C|nr:metallophosphoesterase family protein [Parapedobacter sp. 10938]MEC3879148.1 metallophosphoesterase family protein [Parapedobacter sp. 10938]
MIARGLLFLFTWLTITASAQERFSITHGPYIQALDTTSVNILWTTSKLAISWVELAPDDGSHFYHRERPKHFAVNDGFKTKDTVHRVYLDGLKPGTTYRYRVYSQEVKRHEWSTVEYGTIVASQVYRSAPLRFTTPSPLEETVTFAVINDMHGQNDVMQQLLEQVDFDAHPIVFFNGDMAGFFLSEQQVFTDFMDTGVKQFASQYPMYYARGNHETRGPFAGQFSRYFPSVSGKPYYLVRRGPVCFVVLDSGEDKPDSDIEYGGLAAFDDYRDEQAAWLAEALTRPEFTTAPYKIAICHMPPFKGWHGQHEVIDKFVPLLNQAGIQLMLSGHLHRHIKQQPDEHHAFPVLVNSNKALVSAKGDSRQLQLTVLDTEGKQVDSITLNPSH